MQLEQIFNENRSFLWGLSYRMTGSAATLFQLNGEGLIERIYFVMASGSTRPPTSSVIRVQNGIDREAPRVL